MFHLPNNQARRKVEWLSLVSFSSNFSEHKYVPEDLSVNSNEELPSKKGATEIFGLSDVMKREKTSDRMDMLI